MLTRMTRMARMLTHMLTRMTRWLAGSHIIHTPSLPPREAMIGDTSAVRRLSLLHRQLFL